MEKNAEERTKLDAIIEAAKRIRKEVGTQDFEVVFAAYITVNYGVNLASSQLSVSPH